MAVTHSLLTSGNSFTAASQYTPASISPVGNRLLTAVVFSFRAAGLGNVPTISGNGVTWQQILTAGGSGGTANVRLTIFRGMVASPSAGSPTIDFAGQNQDECHWAFSQFDGVATGGTHGSEAVVQSKSGINTNTSTGLVTLDNAFGSPTNAAFGAFQSPGATDISPGTGFTQISDASSYFTEWRADADQTVDATRAGNSDWLGGAIEIKEAVAGGGVATPTIIGIGVSIQA